MNNTNLKQDNKVTKAYELLHCPFCESNNVHLITGKGKFDRVVCKDCGVTGPWFDGHPIDAVNGWNSMPRIKK